MQEYKALVCAMIERAALDIIQAPSMKCYHKPQKKYYFRYADRQTKKDIETAKRFLTDPRLESIIQDLNIDIPLEKIKKRCGLV